MSWVKDRTKPRISVNKLGEYMAASATRRRSIVRDQRRPATFKIARYGEAERAVVQYLLSRDEQALYSTLMELKADDANQSITPFERQTRSLSAEAIERFVEMLDELELPPASQVVRGRRDPPKLSIQGVQLSVRPEILVYHADPTDATVGAIKLSFAKTYPLNQLAGKVEAGIYVATMLHQYVEQYLTASHRADPELCQVIDIASQSVYTAPRSNARLRGDIEAACEEIAGRWSSLEPLSP